MTDPTLPQWQPPQPHQPQPQPPYQLPQYQQPMIQVPMVYAVKPPSNGLAMTGMILGIVGIPMVFCCYLGIIIGIVGIALSGVGLAKANQLDGLGRTQALAGLITSIVAVVILPAILIILTVIGSAGSAVYTPV